MQTHQEQTKSRTRLWQIGAVVLCAGATAGAILPVGKLLSPDALPKETPAAASSVIDRGALVRGLDLGAAQNALSTLAPPRAPAPPPPKVVAAATTPVQAAPPPPSGEWTYIGSIMSGDARHALVKIDAQQHLLRVGSVRNDSKVTSVEPDHIDIEGKSGEKKRIDLVARTMLVPTDQPKIPVNFRTPPPPKQPVAAMNQPQFRAPGAAAPQTFDQARVNAEARARAEAAARAEQAAKLNSAAKAAGQQVPERSPPGQPGLTQDQRDMAIKTLADPGIPMSQRLSQLRALGAQPGMPLEQQLDYLRATGVDIDSPEFGDARKAIEESAKELENTSGGGGK